MSAVFQPSTPEELCDALRSANASNRTIELFGGNSKRLMAGPVAPADVHISTTGMKRLLQYEPRDLTVSVESGMPLAELNALLARNGQMIPLDGPYCDEATAGGMVAANISGARRQALRHGPRSGDRHEIRHAGRQTGAVGRHGGQERRRPRHGQTHDRLVRNSGRDRVGQLQTHAPPGRIADVLFTFDDLPTALEARNAAIRGVLNPVAVEILNPVLSAQLGLKNFTLAILFAGNQAVIERSVREAAALGPARSLAADEEQRFWSSLHAVTPRFLEKFRDGARGAGFDHARGVRRGSRQRRRPRPRPRRIGRCARLVHASGRRRPMVLRIASNEDGKPSSNSHPSPPGPT